MTPDDSISSEMAFLFASHAQKVRPLRILAVDDHDASRMLLLFVLGNTNHIVHTCKDPTKALALAAEKDYDFFVLDVHMPAMSGAELLDNLRKSKPIYTTTPAILISADQSTDMHYMAGMINNTIFLPKPIAPAKVLQAIEKLFIPA